MNSNDRTDAGSGAAADSHSKLAEIHLTLAQAQRAMAEALLALSQGNAGASSAGTTGRTGITGIAAVAPPSAPTAGSPVFEHSGQLLLGDQGELIFKDGANGLETPLASLAAQGKTVRLSFKLQPEPAAPTESNAQLFNDVVTFFRDSALLTGAMDATCGGDSKGWPPSPSSPQESPAPQPERAPEPPPAEQP